MKTTLLALTLATMPLTADEPKPAAPAAESKDGVKHVDAAGAKKLLDEAAAKKDGKVVALDVRTPDEYKVSRIAGSANIDFSGADFAGQVAKLDKEKTYVVYCAGGGRSTKSLETFRKLGFKNIIHLDGGISGWKQAKLPVEK